MTTKKIEFALILTAAGSSRRMQKIGKKEYLPFSGGTVLSETAAVFLQTLPFDCVVIPYLPGFLDYAKKAFFCGSLSNEELISRKTKIIFCEGGKTRQESVFNALLKIPAEPKSLIFVHDGARPFVSEKIILDCYDVAKEFGAAAPGITPTDTQKEICADGTIRHLRRQNLRAIQTPQVFWFEPFLEAHKIAATQNFDFTDDSEIWDKFAPIEKFGAKKIQIIFGEEKNVKITFPRDTENLKITTKNSAKDQNAQNAKNPIAQKIRTGIGYDKHALVFGRKMIIGGVEIPFEKGEKGHSDGDALVHAAIDAILGAASLGDIGSFFPDDDEKWHNANSLELLQIAWERVKLHGWNLENLDCIIACEKPKILSFRDEMRKNIAQALNAKIDQIFVKGKTGEKLGEVGEGRAVESWAIATLTCEN